MAQVTFKIEGEAEKLLKQRADRHQRDIHGQAKTIVLVTLGLYPDEDQISLSVTPTPSPDEMTSGTNGTPRFDSARS